MLHVSVIQLKLALQEQWSADHELADARMPCPTHRQDLPIPDHSCGHCCWHGMIISAVSEATCTPFKDLHCINACDLQLQQALS